MTAYVVSSGQTSSGLTLNSGDTLTVLAGGAAETTTINAGGSLTVASRGDATSDTILSGGSLTVSSGGRASFDTISSGGIETVGGTIFSPTIGGSGAVLDLLSGAIVSGGITFSGSGGQLQIGGSAMPSTTIFGFGSSGTLDLTSIAFDSAGTVNLTAANVLQVTEGGTTYDLFFDQAQNFTGDYFHLAGDGSGDTLITENTTPPVEAPSVLDDFGWAQGWGSADNPRIITDVNGDGASDYVGFGDQYTFISYGGTFSSGGGTGPGFTSATAAVKDFGTSEGYTTDMQRGAAAAGVGAGDILYGQGYAGVYWYAATGETAATDAAGNTYNVLQYQTSPNFYGNFGSQEGWTADNGFQILKTGPTDASASILGFGDDGIVVGPDAFAAGASASGSYVIPFGAGSNSGWRQSVDIRTFTDQNGKPIDLNGDGIADFVGMGPDGLVYAYGSESGGSYTLGPLETAHIDGGTSNLGEAQGWTDATTVRDIVYDATTGHDDIIAFGAAGVYVAMGQDPTTHGGEPFGQLYLAMADFGSNQGWTVSGTPRLVGDVTGDGIPDIVGFGDNSTYVAVGSRDSSGNLKFTVDPTRTMGDFGAAEGWSGSAEQTLRALGTFPGTGGTGSHADLILSGAYNTQVVPLTSSSSTGSTTSGASGASGDSGPFVATVSAALPAFTTAAIDPTVAITGSPVEGTTLTASAVVTGGFTGTTEFHWQRFYAGSWWNIPVELSPYSTGEVLSYVASPTYVVREEDEDVSAIRVEADFVDNTGLTVAVADSPSVGPVLDEPASLSLSPITGSAVPGATLTVSAEVVTDEGTFTPLIEWQRFYSGGWWDIPIELSPYSSGEALTFVTTPTYVVRAEDANVLAIRAEAIYVDDTGQTLTAFSSAGTSGAALTISQPPRLTAAGVSVGEDQASVALAITVAAHDSDYTLGGVTIGGMPSGWSLSGDGAASIATGTWIAGSGGLGGLTLVAPSALEEESFALSVTASESAAGPTGILAATATTSFLVAVSAVAEAPVFSGTSQWSGSDEASFALSGIAVGRADGDDTLGATATLSGLSAGWTLYDGGVALAASGGVASLAVSDLGALRILAPDGSAPATDSLTLTVGSSEGGSAASGSEVLVVSVSAVAEAPVFSGTSQWSGSDEASFALSGIAVGRADGDDTLGATATLSGLSAGWTLYDGGAALNASGGVASLAVSDLGALRILAPDGSAPAADSLTLTVASSEGGSAASGSEVLVVAVSAVAEAPVFSGTSQWSGSDEASFALSGIAVGRADGDDTLGATATLSGLSAGWTLYDGGVALAASGGVASLAVSDLGALRILAPDGSAPAADSLTLTVASSEGGSAASGSEVLVVAVSAVAEAPVFSGTSAWSGSDEASFALSGIAVAAADGDDTLGATATLSGLSAGWTLYDGGAALNASGGVASLAVSDLGALRIVAPDGSAPATDSLTLTVASSEGGSAASGSEVLVVAVSAVAEAPVFSGTSQWSGSDEASFALSGIAVGRADGDDTLGATATLSGLSAGWTLYDGGVALAAAGGVASLAVSDLGALRILAPDGSAPAADSLTLTVASSEGGSAASGSEVLVVAVSAVAEAPVFPGTSMWSGSDEASFALSGIAVAAADGDDTLGATATLSGLSAGWTLYDGGVALAAAGGVASLAVSDLGALRILAPDGSAPAVDSLTLTVASSEGGSAASGSEVLVVAVSAVAEAPVFSGTSMWSGSDEASFALSGITVAAVDGDDTLGATATLSGLSAGWTLYDGGAALAASGGVASLAVSDLGALRILAPDGSAPAADSLTLTVASSEGGSAASGSEVLVVAVSAVAEAPVFPGTSMWSGSDEASFALSGIAVGRADGDDTLGATATLSGLSAGWTLYDGGAALAASGGVASLAVSDLGALRVLAPDGSAPAADSLTLTVASSEGGAATSGSEVLVVAVSAVAEAPVFSGTSQWSGSDEASFALSGIAVAAADGDDTLGATATLSGLSAGWTLFDGGAALAASGGVASLAVSDLGALRIVAPDGSAPAADSLTLTVASSEGGSAASGSEVLVVAVSAVAEAPVFSGATTFSGGASVTLSGLSVTAGDADDVLNATITGLSSGWTLVDSSSNASFTGTAITAIPVSDLGSLVVVSPSFATDLLTLTVNSSEGGSTASASETVAVTAGPAAMPPSFSGGTNFYGGVSVTLSSLGASAVGGDTLAANATITGLSSGWTLVDTRSTSSFTGSSITAIPVSDLGSLVVVPPAGTTSGSDVLVLTVGSSLGASTTSGSEALTVVAQNYGSEDLSGENLSGANLSGAYLASANLTGSNLSGANLSGAILFQATLTNANLSGANLTGAILFLAGVSSANLSGADLSGAILASADLTDANLTNADLSNALLLFSTLTSAALTGADLSGADLRGADLSGANLNAATLTGTTLPLQLSSLGASAGGHDVTGGVLDGFTGAVTITAIDSATTLGTRTISYSAADQLEPWSIGNVTFAQGDTITVTARDSEGAFYSVSGTVVAAAPAGAAGSPINLALTDPAGGGQTAVTVAGIQEGWSLNAGTGIATGAWMADTSEPSALAITPAGSFVGAAVVSVNENWINPDGSTASAFVTDNVEAYAPGNPIFALSGDDTLSGSGTNDLFVFAQPIANDRIYDFQPASNRIDLTGFPGIASFADLQGKIADDANGNAVLTLGSGETITIVGVDAAALGAGNFLFSAEPVTGNAGAMTIGDGATLPLGGIVDNSGTIALASAGEEAELVVLSDGVTLEGGGVVTLSDNAGNAIVGSGADTTLTNIDNTISGAGRLGDAAMTLDNAGVIEATGVNPLTIDTGGNSIANSGTLEATGAGGLVIRGAVANSGTLSADSGNLTVDGAVTGAGVATIAGSATFEFGAASAESTSFAPGATGTLKLDQSASFTGVVAGFATGDAIDLTDLAFGSNLALGYADNGAGGGVVTVGNAVQVVDLALLGQYAAAGFKAQSDPGGGTLITYTLQTTASDAPLTNPSH